MPPGMLQQMQRQLRSGGGIQEMMKAMMQGQGGDPAEMEEMQREFSIFDFCLISNRVRDDVPNGRRAGRAGRFRWYGYGRRYAEYG